MCNINEFVNHPEGMLDRDQRTMFILQTKSNKNNTCYCDECKSTNFGLRKTYANINFEYLHKNYFLKKSVSRSFPKIYEYLLVYFCIWILTSQHIQPVTIMAMPIGMSSDYKHSKSLSNLEMFLNNPCGFEAESIASHTTHTTDSRQQTSGNHQDSMELDVKFYLEKIEKSAITGLKDFQKGYLKNFLLTDFNIPHESMDKVVDHHGTWKHISNPNLLPNGQHLEIEFLKDLSDATKASATEAARNFDIHNEEHRQQLIKILEDCDERLQRLLVVFYQMDQNLDNFKVNFRQDEFATDNIRKVYTKAINIIRNILCDIRTGVSNLYEASGIEDQSVHIVDFEYILNNPFKTDSIGDWVNVRQLHDQLEYMVRLFGIWAKEIK